MEEPELAHHICFPDQIAEGDVRQDRQSIIAKELWVAIQHENPENRFLRGLFVWIAIDDSSGHALGVVYTQATEAWGYLLGTKSRRDQTSRSLVSEKICGKDASQDTGSIVIALDALGVHSCTYTEYECQRAINHILYSQNKICCVYFHTSEQSGAALAAPNVPMQSTASAPVHSTQAMPMMELSTSAPAHQTNAAHVDVGVACASTSAISRRDVMPISQSQLPGLYFQQTDAGGTTSTQDGGLGERHDTQQTFYRWDNPVQVPEDAHVDAVPTASVEKYNKIPQRFIKLAHAMLGVQLKNSNTLNLGQTALNSMEMSGHLWQHWIDEYRLDFAVRGIAQNIPEYAALFAALQEDYVSMDLLTSLFVPIMCLGRSIYHIRVDILRNLSFLPGLQNITRHHVSLLPQICIH